MAKHKGQYLCLSCESCFSGYSEEHHCANFVEEIDVRRGRFTETGQEWYFTPYTKAERGPAVALQMEWMLPHLKRMFEAESYFVGYHKNHLTLEEREALMPESRVPSHYRPNHRPE